MYLHSLREVKGDRQSIPFSRSSRGETTFAELGTDTRLVEELLCAAQRPVQVLLTDDQCTLTNAHHVHQQAHFVCDKVRWVASGTPSAPMWCGRVIESRWSRVPQCTELVGEFWLLIWADHVRHCCSSPVWIVPDCRPAEWLYCGPCSDVTIWCNAAERSSSWH